MDAWMSEEVQEVRCRECPRCAKPMTLSGGRYKEQVQSFFDDLAAVRSNVTDRRRIGAYVDELTDALMGLSVSFDLIQLIFDFKISKFSNFDYFLTDLDNEYPISL